MSTPPPGSYGESLVGRTLNGVYRLVDLIGTGGFADVYLARDLRTNVTVAVKILHAHVAREAGLVQRFATEAEVARRLTGPNVARALDTGQEPGIPPYFVMEYIQGLPLSEIIRRRGPMPISDAVGLADQALAALSEAHALGIIHRDIKPANLMLGADGVLKVMDFGIARLLERGGNTTVGQVLGTPAYMSPEQVAGRPVDLRTDLYAVGVVLYELLAGKAPFSGTSDPLAAMARVMHEAPAPIQTIRSDLPPALAAVLDRALAKSPDWRYRSAAEMRQALAAASSAAGATAQLPAWTSGPQPGGQTPLPYPPGPPGARTPSPPGPPVPPRPTANPNLVPILLGVGALALLIVGGAIGMLTSPRFFGRATPTPTSIALVATATSAPTPAATVTPAPTTAPPKPVLPTAPPTAAPTTAPPATPAPPTAVPPTREPPTPTPAPPTAVPPRPTATLLPRVAYQANFNADAGGLYIGRDEEREHLVWQGEYTVKTLVSRPINSLAYIPGAFNDGVLAVTARIIDGADYAFVALGCRAQSTSRSSQYYVQMTATPPAVRLHRTDDGTLTYLTNWATSSVIRGGTSANRLELRCIGSTISVAVNGAELLSVRDDHYQAGRWSIGAGTFGDMAGRAEGRFDNLELRTR
ncbi:MAG: serine/threonine-protein kinase [Chloroflexota bacterium]